MWHDTLIHLQGNTNVTECLYDILAPAAKRRSHKRHINDLKGPVNWTIRAVIYVIASSIMIGVYFFKEHKVSSPRGHKRTQSQPENTSNGSNNSLNHSVSAPTFDHHIHLYKDKSRFYVDKDRASPLKRAATETS